jgi:hypothetical protein
MEVVQDVLVLELIRFVEDDDVWWAVIVSESVLEDVCGCGLSVNADCLIEPFEDAV